jgi:hypothetical protein
MPKIREARRFDNQQGRHEETSAQCPSRRASDWKKLPVTLALRHSVGINEHRPDHASETDNPALASIKQSILSLQNVKSQSYATHSKSCFGVAKKQ